MRPTSEQAKKAPTKEAQQYLDTIGKNLDLFRSSQVSGTGKRTVPNLEQQYSKSLMPAGATAQADTSFSAFQKATNNSLFPNSFQSSPSLPSYVTKSNVPKLPSVVTPTVGQEKVSQTVTGNAKPASGGGTTSVKVSNTSSTRTSGTSAGSGDNKLLTPKASDFSSKGTTTVAKKETPAQYVPTMSYDQYTTWRNTVPDAKITDPDMKKEAAAQNQRIMGSSKLTLMEIERTQKKIAELKKNGQATTAQDKYLQTLQTNLGRLKNNPKLDQDFSTSLAQGYTLASSTPAVGVADTVADTGTTAGTGTAATTTTDTTTAAGTDTGTGTTTAQPSAYDQFIALQQQQADQFDRDADIQRQELSNQNFLKNLDLVRNFARRGSLDSGMYQNALAQQAFANAAGLDKISARTDANKLKLATNTMSNLMRQQASQDKAASAERIAQQKQATQIAIQQMKTNADRYVQEPDRLIDMAEQMSKNLGLDTSALYAIASKMLADPQNKGRYYQELMNAFTDLQMSALARADILETGADIGLKTAQSQKAQAEAAGKWGAIDGFQHSADGALIVDADGIPKLNADQIDRMNKNTLKQLQQQSDDAYRAIVASNSATRNTIASDRLAFNIQKYLTDVSATVVKAKNAGNMQALSAIKSQLAAISGMYQGKGDQIPPEVKQSVDALRGQLTVYLDRMDANAQSLGNVAGNVASQITGNK